MLTNYICDLAGENGPSGHIKFHYIFQIWCIITNDQLQPLSKNVTINEHFSMLHFKNTESKYCTQNLSYV